jgi:hypothetical protein
VKSTPKMPRGSEKAEARDFMRSHDLDGWPEAGEGVAALRLNDRGLVCDCNSAAEALFKYRRGELAWRHVSMLLPQLAEMELMQNGLPNSRLRFLCRIGRRFQAVAQDGERFASELFLNFFDNIGHGRLSLIVRPAVETSSGDGLRVYEN